MRHQDLIHRLAQPSPTRIVLLVLDGVGDLRSESQPETALDAATLPNLDALAARAALGRITPVVTGVTPGSGPGHLALFGYDPRDPEADIGRGVLEALGLGLQVAPGQVAVRGNYATADSSGNLTDRRAGRIPTSECRRLCDSLRRELPPIAGLEVQIEPGEEHRFVLIFSGEDLSAAIADTDPQQTGVPPLAPRASDPSGEAMAQRVTELVSNIQSVIADEPQANRVLLRGFSKLPHLRSISDLYGLKGGSFAGYPLYRGVAAACGMDVVECGKEFTDIVTTVGTHWDRFDFFFLHVKQPDKAGEDGNLGKKVEVLESVDRHLPELLALEPDVIAITGDHSTPAPIAAHSWHPVPVLVQAEHCFIDECREFSEVAAAAGHLGTIPAHELMGLLLANAGKLAKFGA